MLAERRGQVSVLKAEARVLKVVRLTLASTGRDSERAQEIRRKVLGLCTEKVEYQN